ncbi:MAG: D-alanyl-D-alanine carboxypeptidase [Christensenellaceae bacterium]|nr:D-alanyl-D-alanine carboxypeptidase [Christensenellaceae bacterium]
MKRTISALLSALMLVVLLPAAALAEFDPSSISTPYVCLLDGATGSILYSHNAHERAYPASTTKIMTCILAIEASDDLYETINVGSQFDTSGSVTSPYPISRSEKLRIIDLLYCILLVSGNDAASALATHIAGSQEAFADRMNQKAQQIGMTETHFTNANGLHDEDHYSTAYDMALLGRYAMQNEAFRKIVNSESYEVPKTNKNPARLLENSNRLLHTKTPHENIEYAYATGIKTGDTKFAGRCLITSAKKDGVELVLSLLGDMEGKVASEYRFYNAAKFFDWGFANYASVQANDLTLETQLEAPVSNAAFAEGSSGGLAIQAGIEPDAVIAGLSEKIEAIKADATAITHTETYTGGALVAPIAAGDTVGSITYSYEGEPILTADLIAAASVDEIGNVVAANPSASPLLVDINDTPKGNPFLIWFIILAVALILYVLYKVFTAKRARTRRRRSTAYRYKTKR